MVRRLTAQLFQGHLDGRPGVRFWVCYVTCFIALKLLATPLARAWFPRHGLARVSGLLLVSIPIAAVLALILYAALSVCPRLVRRRRR